MKLPTIALLLMLFVSTAWSQTRDPLAEPTDEVAREHYAMGRSLYRLGRFQEAIVEFEKGAVIADIAVWQFNLGQCYRRLSNYDKAIWHFERFIGLAGSARSAAKHVEAARQLIETMRAASQRPPTETMPEATFPKSPPAPKPEPAPAPQPEPKAVDTAIATPAPPPPARWYHDVVGWGLVGGSVALLGTSTGLAVSAAGLRDDAADAGDQRSHNRLLERADTRSTWAIVALAGGAAVGAVGVVRLVLTPDRGSLHASTLHLDAGLGWAGVRLTF